jgi:hypothetical protein
VATGRESVHARPAPTPLERKTDDGASARPLPGVGGPYRARRRAAREPRALSAHRPRASRAAWRGHDDGPGDPCLALRRPSGALRSLPACLRRRRRASGSLARLVELLRRPRRGTHVLPHPPRSRAAGARGRSYSTTWSSIPTSTGSRWPSDRAHHPRQAGRQRGRRAASASPGAADQADLPGDAARDQRRATSDARRGGGVVTISRTWIKYRHRTRRRGDRRDPAESEFAPRRGGEQSRRASPTT